MLNKNKSAVSDLLWACSISTAESTTTADLLGILSSLMKEIFAMDRCCTDHNFAAGRCKISFLKGVEVVQMFQLNITF